jgi:1-phosphatidylinositol-3-phosphate 5-kinase
MYGGPHPHRFPFCLTQHNREAAPEANGYHHSPHGVDQSQVVDADKHINHHSTDDNAPSSASGHRHGGISRHASTSSVDDRSIKSGDDSDGAESTNGRSSNTEISFLENDTVWIPPQAADKEDEAQSFATSIAYDDDDDDYSDGIKWGQSSFPSPGKQHDAGTSNHREVREKAMLEAMNGQLKILVSRFLASVGIPSSNEEASDSWLDIVTSLSWEAALLIKPDGSMGKEMDPGSYIKVKCIASGTRRQR